MSKRFKRVLFYTVGLMVWILAGLAAILALAWVTNGYAIVFIMAASLGYLCSTIAIAHVNELERKEARGDASS